MDEEEENYRQHVILPGKKHLVLTSWFKVIETIHRILHIYDGTHVLSVCGNNFAWPRAEVIDIGDVLHSDNVCRECAERLGLELEKNGGIPLGYYPMVFTIERTPIGTFRVIW